MCLLVGSLHALLLQALGDEKGCEGYSATNQLLTRFCVLIEQCHVAVLCCVARNMVVCMFHAMVQ